MRDRDEVQKSSDKRRKERAQKADELPFIFKCIWCGRVGYQEDYHKGNVCKKCAEESEQC